MYQDQHAIDTQLCCWWEIKCKKKRKEKKKYGKLRQELYGIIWRRRMRGEFCPSRLLFPTSSKENFLYFFWNFNCVPSCFQFWIVYALFFFLKSERDDWDVKVLKMPLLNSCMICTFGNWYSWEISTYQRGKVFFFFWKLEQTQAS